jgi:hypothetical protein
MFMSLRSKPLEMIDELKDCFALDAGGSARKPASPLVAQKSQTSPQITLITTDQKSSRGPILNL